VPTPNVTWYFNKAIVNPRNFDNRRVKGLFKRGVLGWVPAIWKIFDLTFGSIQLNFPSFFLPNRFIMLKNGSLLIVNAKKSDSGKYKCNASNEFTQKPTRSFGLNLIVEVAPEKFEKKGLLLPAFQPQDVKVKEGKTLLLHCAGYSKQVNWTFTPRFGKVPIVLSGVGYELKFVNVDLEKHDGIYNCSTESDFQVGFHVIYNSEVFRRGGVIDSNPENNCS
jgi:hypothetical protein